VGFFIFPKQTGNQIPQSIFTQNGLSEVDSCKDMAFVVKNLSFFKPWTSSTVNH